MSGRLIGDFLTGTVHLSHFANRTKQNVQGIEDWVPYPILTPPQSYHGILSTFDKEDVNNISKNNAKSKIMIFLKNRKITLFLHRNIFYF
jgi:hypothetical protein